MNGRKQTNEMTLCNIQSVEKPAHGRATCQLKGNAITIQNDMPIRI